MKYASFQYLCFFFLVLLGACKDDDCNKKLGVIELTAYDWQAFNNTYTPGQEIRFLRNGRDTVIFKVSGYYKEDIRQSSNEELDCGSLYSYDCENHGIYINTPFQDTSFYLFVRTIYNRRTGEDFQKTGRDTLSYMEFGVQHKNYVNGALGHIELNADLFYKDTILLDGVLLNGRTFNDVYYYKNPNPYWSIKEIYFHPAYGVIKFSFYKPNSLTLDGDYYEILL